MEAAIGLKPLKIGNLVAKHPVIQGGMGVGVSLSSCLLYTSDAADDV